MWTKQQDVKDTLKISVSLEMNKELFMHMRSDSFDSEKKIKKELSQKLAEELFKNNLLQVTRHEDFYTMSSTFETSLNIVPPSHTKAIIEDYEYEIDNVRFTHKQIEAAVKKSLPEYFV